MGHEFLVFLLILVVSGVTGLPREERYTHGGLKHVVQFLGTGLSLSIILWVMVYLHGWEAFFGVFGVGVNGWHVTEILEEIRCHKGKGQVRRPLS